MTSQEHHQDNLGQGHRLRLAITLCGFKIPLFARKYKISVSSLYYIENGIKHLTNKMAERISHALLQEGCLCNPEWLLTSKGIPPSLSQKDGLYLVNETDIESLEDFSLNNFKILKEINFFKSLYCSTHIKLSMEC